jgi:hypothetical protein
MEASGGELVECPRCGAKVPHLAPVETGLKLQLQESGQELSVPDQVCIKCFNELRKTGSHGAKLRAQAKAREEHRIQLWASRVNMIKQARKSMQEKKYSDAAVAYERYLKALEIVFDAEPGGLNPDHFRKAAHQKELTVVTSTYWDLVCIYDTSPRYGNRMVKSVDKLAEFARYTPIYAAIVRKAQAFEKRANNPGNVKRFLMKADAARPFCFVATTVFGERGNPHVATLVRFRDEVLEHSHCGRLFISLYYMTSPWFARALEGPLFFLKPSVRWVLALGAWLLGMRRIPSSQAPQ